MIGETNSIQSLDMLPNVLDSNNNALNSCSLLDQIENSENGLFPSKNCFSLNNDKVDLEMMTFSMDKGKKNTKSRLMRTIEEFKLSNFCSLEEKKIPVSMTTSHNRTDTMKNSASMFRSGFSEVKDYYINKQTLSFIVKRKERKQSILAEIQRPFTEQLKASLFIAFHSHFLFKSFGESQKKDLFDNVSCFIVEKAHTIFQEGEMGEFLYFIESGSVMKLRKGKVLTQINHQKIIGEEMILSVKPMVCSYVASEKCVLWGICNKILAQILLSLNEEKYKENRNFLEPLSFVSSLSETQKDELSYYMNDVRYNKGKIVLDEMAEAQNFYIIKEGCVLVTCNNKFLYYLNKGDSFGDNFFIKSKRNFTVKVESNFLDCLCLNKERFSTILGKNSDNLVINSNIRTMLKKSFFFSKVPPIFIEKLLKEMNVECFLAESIVDYHYDNSDFQIIFIADGSLVSTDGKVFYDPNQIIGEELLWDSKLKPPKELRILQDSILGFLTKSQVEKVIGIPVKEILMKKYERKYSLNSSSLDHPKKQLEINKSEMLVIKELGEGISGVVLLVKYDHILYALKIVSKGWIIENKLESYIRNEKKIHQKISFPMLTSLITTWKDDVSIYFLMEFIQGKELFAILNSKISLEVPELLYLAVCLILTLENLHIKGIMHRDLKPENIMINMQGNLKVCDLGFGKILLSNSERSYTIVGTHHYMSPEMISGKGYGFLADYWAVGVILYESFYGRLPFAQDLEDPFLICAEIVKKKLVFPKDIKRKEVKSLIRQLLRKSPEKRLGEGGINELKAQSIFENVNWKGILEQKVESPFKLFMEGLNVDNYEGSDNNYISLLEVIQNENIEILREITQQLCSDYKDWDDIF